MMKIINQLHHFQLFNSIGCLCASPLGCFSDASYPIKHCPVDTRCSTAAKCFGSQSSSIYHLCTHPKTWSSLSATHAQPLEPLQVYLYLSILQASQSVRDCLCIIHPSACLKHLIHMQEPLKSKTYCRRCIAPHCM